MGNAKVGAGGWVGSAVSIVVEVGESVGGAALPTQQARPAMSILAIPIRCQKLNIRYSPSIVSSTFSTPARWACSNTSSPCSRGHRAWMSEHTSTRRWASRRSAASNGLQHEAMTVISSTTTIVRLTCGRPW